MCESMVDIQSATAEIRRGKKQKRKKERRRTEERNRTEIKCPRQIRRAAIINPRHLLLDRTIDTTDLTSQVVNTTRLILDAPSRPQTLHGKSTAGGAAYKLCSGFATCSFILSIYYGPQHLLCLVVGSDSLFFTAFLQLFIGLPPCLTPSIS